MLRQFGKGKKDHAQVMDKQIGRKFSFSASKKVLISVAAGYGMYDFEFMGETPPISRPYQITQAFRFLITCRQFTAFMACAW